MKLIFKENDTIFKIFSTIEKLHTSQKVEIYIHHKNPFFQNKWWLKQLIKILDNNWINYIFICDSTTKNFFENLKVPCKIKNDLFSILKRQLNNYFTKIKNFHYHILKPKSLIWKLVITLEIIFLIALGYSFYKFMSFEANIYLREAKNIDTIIYNFFYYPYGEKPTIEKLSIPYIIWSWTIQKTLTINVKDIKYNLSPSSGKIEIYNYTDKQLSFRANTKFITENGLLFRSPTWFAIPPKKWNQPWKTIITLIALEKDINWNIIWKKWNIKKWTKLYILKFPLSKDKKLIVGKAINDFQWWKTDAIWIVNQEDIDYLSQHLIKQLEKNKLLLLKKNINNKNIIILPFEDLLQLNISKIDINAKPWDKRVEIKWTIYWNIRYHYILFSDFKKSVETYFKQRQIDTIKIEEIRKNSIKFLEKINIDPRHFIITTQFEVIKWYDFEKDRNNLLSEIKNKIIGKNKTEAEKIILSYPQISSVEIKISPPWYDFLPKLKSKIKFHIIK